MAANPNNHSELARIKEEERKKAIKVHEDVGIMKRKEPTKFWKWFSEMFLSGRTWKDICMDIINNQIVPELKDGFRNSVVSMLDMRLYRDHRAGTSSPSGTPTSFVTNYVQYGDKKAQQQAALDANKKKEEETINNGYDIPSFRNLAAARVFLDDMKAYVSKYDRITVLELGGMMKRNLNYTWDKYGWDKEEILAIKDPVHVNNREYPYIIELPKAHVLSDD